MNLSKNLYRLPARREDKVKKFRKWFLIVLVLVLAIGWNVNCRERPRGLEPLPVESRVDASSVDGFLTMILVKILQEIPENIVSKFDIKIEIVSLGDFADAFILPIGDIFSILISEKLLLLVESEAEIAFIIAHEAGHVVLSEFPGLENYDSLIEIKIDHAGIKLMAKAGYSTCCAVDLLQKILKRDKDRLAIACKNAKKYFQKNQKKWLLFTPEDLKKIKDFIREKNPN